MKKYPSELIKQTCLQSRCARWVDNVGLTRASVTSIKSASKWMYHVYQLDMEHILYLELEGNCAFSSNNNVWTWFYDFFGSHFEFWVIFIMTDYLYYVFLAAILNWNYKFLDSDFFVGLMLYHCLRCWPNIKTTLCRCFVFNGITTKLC